MEQFVAVVLLNAVALYVLHLALYRHVGLLLTGALVPAVAAVLLYPLVIEQDLASLQVLLHGREPMLTLAALLAAESLLGVLGVGVRLRERFGLAAKPWQRALGHFPGVGVLLAVFCAQVTVFHLVSGRDFREVAFGFAAAMLLVLLAVPLLLRYAVSEWELRLELRLLLLLVQLGMAVVLSILVSRLPVTAAVAPTNYAALGALAAAAVLIAALGYLRYRFNLRRSV